MSTKVALESDLQTRRAPQWTAKDLPLGATLTGNAVRFLVWAPCARKLELHIVAPDDRLIPMARADRGYWRAEVAHIPAGTRYFLRLNGERDRPDPATRSQPDCVHGASEVIDWQAKPQAGWSAPSLRDYIIYELHVGTFTPEGTLDAIIPRLDRLQQLGVNAIEVMPVAEFPGTRNWGYDGVCPFAVESGYGGLEALRRLVSTCHARGMAIILDVVYNHLGPEGNYLSEFGPYFTNVYRTPWGQAMNFDGPGSDEVRRFFLENAMYWIRDCEVDALRLDAVHAIFDRSAYPFLEQLADEVHLFAQQAGRNVYLIAESDLNDARLLRPKQAGGMGIDAQWADDLHHCIHTLVTGERSGYYSDFGDIEQFAAALRQGWVYTGQYSATRERHFGSSTEGLRPEQFVVCAQNHDQVGNRMNGERLAQIAGLDKARLAAAAYLLSPFTPMIFMGEEYADPAPFLYHVSHTDPGLQECVRKGRCEEFAAFAAQGLPPDPQDEATFERCKLQQELVLVEPHASLHAFYTDLIRLRKVHPAMREMRKHDVGVRGTLVESRRSGDRCDIRLIFNLGDTPASVPAEGWNSELDTSSSGILSNGKIVVAPWSCVLLTKCDHE